MRSSRRAVGDSYPALRLAAYRRDLVFGGSERFSKGQTFCGPNVFSRAEHIVDQWPISR